MKKMMKKIIWFCVLSCGIFGIMFCLPAMREASFVTVSYTIAHPTDQSFQVFYKTESNEPYTEEKSVSVFSKGSDSHNRTLFFELPETQIAALRLDFGNQPGSLLLGNLQIAKGNHSKAVSLSTEGMEAFIFNQVKVYAKAQNYAIESEGNDPYICLEGFSYGQEISDTAVNWPLLLITSLLLSVLLFRGIISASRLIKQNGIRKVDVALFFVFLLIIIVPMVTRDPFDEQKEKRKPANLPTTITLDFPASFEGWFNDHFGFRSHFIASYARLNYLLFDTLPNENARVGKNNWLFYTKRADGNPVAKYQNAVLFTQEELEKIKKKQLEIYDYLHARGITYAILAAPNKGTIYPEFFPPGICKVTSLSKMDQVIDYLSQHTNIIIVDPRSRLLAEKETTELYYAADTHWNSYGGFIVYQELIQKLSKHHPELVPMTESDFNISLTHDVVGDLLGMGNISPSDFKGVFNYYAFQPVTPYAYRQEIKEKRNFITLMDDDALPNALVYRDSFFTAIQPFFSANFSYVDFQWRHPDVESLKQKLEMDYPDIVVFEFVERAIDNLLL